MTSTPISEQDAVVLFNQLLAGGVIRSTELMAASTFVKYDGVFYCIVLEELIEYLNDPNKYYDKFGSQYST